MLTREENDLLCRVGPNAPMGKTMRRYWVPAILSEELEPAGDPKRIRLFGEDLVAFRDDRGRVGLLDENCPHRGASLALARSEGCALRCLYHGWKVDVDGNILETPAEPDEHAFKDRVKALAYEVHEAGGVVWAYMGPRGEAPPPMNFEFVGLPESHRMWLKVRIDANWAQGIEGVIDNAHVSFLHYDTIRTASGVATTTFDERGRQDRPSNDIKPKMETQNTAYGFRYAAIRKPIVDPETTRYVRVTLFVAPFYGIFPAPAGWGNMQAFVPIDDEHTMLFFVRFKYDSPITPEEREQTQRVNGLRPGADVNPDFSKVRNISNNWLQDRAAMQSGETYSGIAGVNTEDIAVQESMGAVYDRSKEHLGTSDIAVIRMRHLMIDSARRFVKDGEAPLGLREPVAYDKLRAEEKIISIDTPWQTVGAFAGEPV
ncbi:MAG TPA: Rieske 2Fe-2S domain-containing protein [Candidatus Cybelea sp.]